MPPSQYTNEASVNPLQPLSELVGWLCSTTVHIAIGLALGLFQQAANYLVGGIFGAVAVFAVFIIVLLVRPEGFAGAAVTRRV